MSPETLVAKPTIAYGIKFRSRLEARFYEWMKWGYNLTVFYEPTGFPSKQGYLPDFLIVELELFVETKPKELLHTLDIFMDDINDSGLQWIVVDQRSVVEWEIIGRNRHFAPGLRFSKGTPFGICQDAKDRFGVVMYPEEDIAVFKGDSDEYRILENEFVNFVDPPPIRPARKYVD